MAFNPLTYFENIARESVYIRHTDEDPHFSVASGLSEIEEFLQNLIRNDNIQLIIIDDIAGSFDNDDSVNLYDSSMHAFIICKHVDEIGDMRQRNLAMLEAKKIGRKIIGRIAKEQNDAAKLPPKYDTLGVRQINQNSFKYFTVGPLAGNFFGVQFSFTSGEPFNDHFDNEEWEFIS